MHTLIYGFRGDADNAFEWLNFSLESQDYFPTFVLSEEAFHSLHDDPRWALYLEQLGLLDYWLKMTPGQSVHPQGG